MTDKLLSFVRNKEGAIHWWGQRATSLILIPLLAFIMIDTALCIGSADNPTVMLFVHTLFNHNPLIMFITNIILLWHIRSGMEIVIGDYVHGEKVQIISILFLRILAIQIMKYIYLCCVIF